MCDVFLIDDESDIRIALAQSFELADLNAQFFASVEGGTAGNQGARTPIGDRQ